ncbi:hypothetical protein GmHk_07G019709 [Glycine max]|nr:hypothetical protein GmHk_07G019709 [Glycine max]
MKDCKNTSGEDVSFTSWISQSLTNSSQALKPAPAQALVFADRHIAKSLKTLWNLDLSLSRNPRHAKLRIPVQTPFSKSDFRLK